MNPQQQAAKLAEMYQTIADNVSSYFEYMVNGNWGEAMSSPSLPNDLSKWRVHVPPKKQVIDLSVLIKSQIDCEFSTNPDHVHISKLSAITDGGNYIASLTEFTYKRCRPRMNHLHAWQGGECPLPEGLEVKLYFRDSDFSPQDLALKEYDWGHSNDRGDIMAFEILSKLDGWIWPFESEE